MRTTQVQKALAVCAGLAVLITIACSKNKIDYVKKTQDIEKKACACADNPCAKLAFNEYKSLFEELKNTRATGSTKELRQINDAANKIRECLKKNNITEKEIDDLVKSVTEKEGENLTR